MFKLSLFFSWFFFLNLVNVSPLFAQQTKESTADSTGVRVDMQKQNEDTILIKTSPAAVDSSGKSLLALDTTATVKKHNPKIATLRSAIIPGWGQAYNKKYWKIPIVYGALGTTAGVFFYNIQTYQALRKAVVLRSDTIPSNDVDVDSRFRTLSTEAIRTYRNAFRQNIDYSVLLFLVFWGLNVVDATVDAHLKAFDVSPDITMKIVPGVNYLANGAGISLVFNFKNK